MKAQREEVSLRLGQQALLAYRLELPAFEFFWHYHAEYELTLILAGTGMRLVGDHCVAFRPGELVLLGPQVPHTWVSDQEHPETPCRAVVIQFAPALFEQLAAYPELSRIQQLLKRAERGLLFSALSDAASQIEALLATTGIHRMTGLLTLLDAMADWPGPAMASALYRPALGLEQQRRVNIVCRYVQEQLTGPVSLSEAARLVHLSDSAFCRFFKTMTGKTFSDYVNELRIGYACRLLAGQEATVSEVAYQAGYQSLTYFNRVFATKKGMPPSQFRKQFFSR